MLIAVCQLVMINYPMLISSWNWEQRSHKRKPGRPRKDWVDVIKRDLRQLDLTWEEAEELANDKAKWRRRVSPMQPPGCGMN